MLGVGSECSKQPHTHNQVMNSTSKRNQYKKFVGNTYKATVCGVYTGNTCDILMETNEHGMVQLPCILHNVYPPSPPLTWIAHNSPPQSDPSWQKLECAKLDKLCRNTFAEHCLNRKLTDEEAGMDTHDMEWRNIFHQPDIQKEMYVFIKRVTKRGLAKCIVRLYEQNPEENAWAINNQIVWDGHGTSFRPK